MATVHMPPNPYLDRRNLVRPRTHDHQRSAHNVLAVVLTFLGLLAVAATGGAIWFVPQWIEQARIEARMGPGPNLATLPTVNFPMADPLGRSLELSLKLELAPKVDPAVVEPHVERIFDRLNTRLQDVGVDRLSGTEGATLVKDLTRSIAQRELGKVKVKDVLIDGMLIRTPYS